MKHIIITLNLIFCLVIHANPETNNVFLAGYQQYQKGFTMLDSVLKFWSKTPKPREMSGPNAPIGWKKEAYVIFEDIWVPTNIVRLGDFENPNMQYWYVNSHYLLVQNKLNVYVATDTNTFAELCMARLHLSYKEPTNKFDKYVIKDFRPKVKIFSEKTIILTEKRSQTLLAFLSNKSHPVGTDNIMNPARAKGESRKRANYILEFIPIQHGHWEGWNLVAYPEVFDIILNPDFTCAAVSFRIGYQGGTAMYQKNKNGKWKMIKSKETWIE